MAATAQPRSAIAGIDHHTACVNGTELHYVSSGAKGTPILLVHGFPETWWSFHKLIPLLADSHRVFAVDPAALATPPRQMPFMTAQQRPTTFIN